MGYRPLSIHNGYGNVHMNRFRICVRPPANRNDVSTIGSNLLWNMEQYMDASSAAVQYGEHKWGGHPTLKFRGVARLRPFSVPVQVTYGGITVWIPIPERIRDWMAPDVHSDSVGVVARHGSGTGFTVQTLKREYEDGDDKALRGAIRALVTSGAIAVPAAIPAASILADLLGGVAVHYNQHHFLAGRRAFRFDWGKHFGYRDDRCVFETVAIERFSSAAFAGSVLAMGDVESLVRNVWVSMLTRFCVRHGLEVIRGEAAGPGWSKWNDVHYTQGTEPDRVTAIVGNPHYPTMSAEHQQILEPR
jgi:hypothetical protein